MATLTNKFRALAGLPRSESIVLICTCLIKHVRTVYGNVTLLLHSLHLTFLLSYSTEIFPYAKILHIRKKGLTHERAPTPNFWPNFLHRVKVYSNERPPWSELCVKFEKHGIVRYAYLR